MLLFGRAITGSRVLLAPDHPCTLRSDGDYCKAAAEKNNSQIPPIRRPPKLRGWGSRGQSTRPGKAPHEYYDTNGAQFTRRGSSPAVNNPSRQSLREEMKRDTMNRGTALPGNGTLLARDLFG